jgi:hypothetical protein
MSLTQLRSRGILDGTITAGDFASGVGGKVLQVVQTVKTDTFSSSSSSLTDITGMSVTITPSSASNKVLIVYSLGSFQSSGATQRSHLSLIRGSTAIIIGDAATGVETTTATCLRSNSGDYHQLSQSFTFLDSPNTTSATTYKLQGVSPDSTTFYLNRGGVSDVYNANTGSTIIAMEIAG